MSVDLATLLAAPSVTQSIPDLSGAWNSGALSFDGSSGTTNFTSTIIDDAILLSIKGFFDVPSTWPPLLYLSPAPQIRLTGTIGSHVGGGHARVGCRTPVLAIIDRTGNGAGLVTANIPTGNIPTLATPADIKGCQFEMGLSFQPGVLSPYGVLQWSGAVSGCVLRVTYQARCAITSIAPNHGPVGGGTPITITGTGFWSGITDVVIAGSLLCTSVVVVNDTTITAVTPAGAIGTYDVLLGAPVGIVALDGTSFIPGSWTWDAPSSPILRVTQAPVEIVYDFAIARTLYGGGGGGGGGLPPGPNPAPLPAPPGPPGGPPPVPGPAPPPAPKPYGCRLNETVD